MTADLEMNQELIVRAFDDLARISGVEFTGAAKMLHLLNRRVFVMWDGAIMGHKGSRREYDNLEVVSSGFWTRCKFLQNGFGYYEFLRTCRNKFRGLVSAEKRKTLAKCIDEFNFCTITVHLARIRNQTPED